MDRLPDQVFVNKREVLQRRREQVAAEIATEEARLTEARAEFAALSRQIPEAEVRKASRMRREAFLNAFVVGFGLVLILGLTIVLSV